MKHAQQTITDLGARLQELQTEARRIKTAINCLCEVIGEKPRYDEVVEKPSPTNPPRSDEYYGKPLATVITEVLEKRKETGLGAAMLDEIYDQLVVGGCKLIGKNDGIKKRGLAIAMSKNQKFHKLPNDTWGLTEWYPTAKETKETSAQVKTEEGQKEKEIPDQQG